MTAYRCDRCGQYFTQKEPSKIKALLSLYSTEKHQFYCADLCSTCSDSLFEWTRKGRIFFTDEELEVMNEEDNK